MQRSDAARTWHVITGEYPPDVGGVADYTATVAHALAEAGDEVHVWTAGTAGTTDGKVVVHRVFGRFEADDLVRASRLFMAFPDSDRLLVQWVPHAFGRRGVNLRFPWWLHRRRFRSVDVMVHEPFMPFAGSARHHAAAAIQRIMTAAVLRSASRLFVGTPAWIRMCRVFAPRVSMQWMPIPSGVPVLGSATEAATYRRQWTVAPDEPLIGCFGRAGGFQETVVEQVGRSLLARHPRARVLLIGLGSDEMAARLRKRDPSLSSLLRATGVVNHSELSTILRACDVMLQPYDTGICARHSSVAALLAHGKPIVTNSGRFTEGVWTTAEAVSLAGSSEPSAFVAATLQLIGDAPERRRLSTAARELYDAHFDVRHTIAALRA